MTIGKRLELFREHLDLTQIEIAKVLGVSDKTYWNFAKEGTKINSEHISKLVKNYCLNPTWLITGIGEMLLKGVDRQENITYIPILSNKTAAGDGEEACKAIINNYFSLSTLFITENLKVKPENLIMMTVSGTSMIPTLTNNDLILVNTDCKKLIDNYIFVIQMDDDLLVKRAFRIDETTYELISDNTALYRPKIVSTSINFKIIGQVIARIEHIPH